jgi:hypothetical protein
MLMNINTTTLVPCRKMHTTLSAVVIDILERINHVWNPAQTPSEAAETESPGTIQKLV